MFDDGCSGDFDTSTNISSNISLEISSEELAGKGLDVPQWKIFFLNLKTVNPAEINREKKNKTRKVVSSVNDVGNDIDVPVYVGQ